MDCIVHEDKTKALINCAVTAQLIYVHVSAFENKSHDAALKCKKEINNALGFLATRFIN